MGKLDKPLMSFGASGTLADALTYQRAHGTDFVRKKPVPPYTRTLPQVYQRWEYQDYVAWWNTLTATQKRVWQSAASRYHMTGFAYWMRDKLKDLPDLAGRWHLDEATGAIAYDSSRNTNNGTIYGATPATGPIDGCRYFDGINDYINVPTHPTLDPTQGVTYECFLKPVLSAFGYAYHIVISKSPGDLNGLYIRQGAIPNYIAFRLYISGVQRTVLSSTLEAKLYHVAGTYDLTTMCLDLDGELDNSASYPGTLDIFQDQPLRIGGGIYNRDTRGTIDEPRLYNRALSQSDIKRHAERRYP